MDTFHDTLPADQDQEKSLSEIDKTVAGVAGDLALGQSFEGIRLVEDKADDSKEKSTDDFTIRAVRPEDLDDLVWVELQAFADVYGKNPSQERVDDIRQKYSERIELLGDWIRVLDDNESGVFGMIVCCPTDRAGTEFVDNNMTNNSFIDDAYDPEGKNIYIVNLAVAANNTSATSKDLFLDVLDLCTERGVERAYFESRLPGFNRWLKRQGININASKGTTATEDELDKLAEQYWQETKVVDGVEKPVDRLLSLYTDFGCKPLQLVKGAWVEDQPSKTYGVLCEYVNRNLVPDASVSLSA